MALPASFDEFCIGDNDTALGGEFCNEKGIAETGLGMGVGVPVADFEVDGSDGLGDELVDVLPLVAELDLVDEVVLAFDDAAGFEVEVLFLAGIEGDGLDEADSAETDVGEMGACFGFDSQDHVAERRHGIVRRHPADAGEVGRYGEADFAQGGCEEGVLLEAVAAAFLRDEFIDDVGELGGDCPVEQYVEVFEGDVFFVQAVQAFEAGEGGSRGGVESDSLEVGF